MPQYPREELLDLVIEAYSFSLAHPLPAYVNPFKDESGKIAADMRNARSEEVERREITGVRLRDRKLTMTDGKTLICEPVIEVDKEDVMQAGEFKPHAASVPWPDVFYMLSGKDLRGRYTLTEMNGRKRHSIDWHRQESSIEDLPNIGDRKLPYREAMGTNSHIAEATSRMMNNLGTAMFDTIVQQALLAAGIPSSKRKDQSVRNTVRDALNDLALFGIIVRCKDEWGNPVYVHERMIDYIGT